MSIPLSPFTLGVTKWLDTILDTTKHSTLINRKESYNLIKGLLWAFNRHKIVPSRL